MPTTSPSLWVVATDTFTVTHRAGAPCPCRSPFHFGRMQTVQLVMILGLLREQPLHLVQQVSELGLEVRRHPAQLTRHINLPDPPNQCLELLQVTAHVLVLLGMSVTGNLAGQPGSLAVVVLAQRKSCSPTSRTRCSRPRFSSLLSVG